MAGSDSDDDRAADDVAGLYDRRAVDWDSDRQFRRPSGEQSWIKRFAAEVGPGGRVLDLGCGSGVPVTPDLLGAGLSITGVDASPALIALCQSRFPSENWVVADMRGLDLGQQFSGLLAWHSLFHLTQGAQREMFAVFARHTAPGAPLMFTSGARDDVTVGQWRGDALYHASLDPAEYRRLLEENGFVLIDHVTADPDCGGASIWLARRDTR